MRQFLRINLLLGSILFLFSCASYSDGFVEQKKTIQTFTPIYLTDFQEETFKISIEAFDQNFGGILVAKKINTHHFRFAFLNEFGAKLMDFELINREFKLNYAMDELNKKRILNMLETDFVLLFSEENEVESLFTNSNSTLLKSRNKIGNKSIFYQLNSKNELEKIILATRKEKLRIDVKKSQISFPDFEISHGKLPIKIYLHLLEINEN